MIPKFASEGAARVCELRNRDTSTERRRLEALTSLHMVTHGAMYTAWQTGKPPQNYQHILEVTGMTAQELFMPDGNAAAWDAEKKIDHSSAFNTQHFATPLIEIPIENVTRSEAQEYGMFRDQYMGLWRNFFDPIGIRFSLKKEQVKTEIYILPLVTFIEVLSFLSRPISHSVRLFANMLAGHITLKVFASFVTLLGGLGIFGIFGATLPLSLVVALTALELLVAFLQAYVFAILTCIYLNDAIHPGH